MIATIAICTLNRAESLRRTIKSLAAMRVPDDLDWEIVIVNNNCTDHTDAVVEAFVDCLPIRREFAPERGLSNARNRAVDVAKGDYIIWTDDDVVVDPGWLAAYHDAFRRWPDAAVFGGPVRPRYEAPVVKWVAQSEALLGGPYCIRDLGSEAIPLSRAGRQLPMGANFAVRSAEQRAFRYDHELGVGPALRRMGEEHDVIERILQSGRVGYPVPAARVEHCIGHERQTVSYIARYFAAAGETDAFLGRRKGHRPNGMLWFGIPVWAWRDLIEGWLLYRILWIIAPGSVWVRYLRAYSYASGAIKYWRSIRNDAYDEALRRDLGSRFSTRGRG